MSQTSKKDNGMSGPFGSFGKPMSGKLAIIMQIHRSPVNSITRRPLESNRARKRPYSTKFGLVSRKFMQTGDLHDASELTCFTHKLTSALLAVGH